jgi:hypothetical protein
MITVSEKAMGLQESAHLTPPQQPQFEGRPTHVASSTILKWNIELYVMRL